MLLSDRLPSLTMLSRSTEAGTVSKSSVQSILPEAGIYVFLSSSIPSAPRIWYLLPVAGSMRSVSDDTFTHGFGLLRNSALTTVRSPPSVISVKVIHVGT